MIRIGNERVTDEDRPVPKMIRSFPSLSSGPNINRMSHMFVQDLSNTIVPYSNHDDDGISVQITGKDIDVAKAKDLINKFGSNRNYQDKEIVFDAVRDISQSLLWDGRLHYEISEHNERLYPYYFTQKNLYKIFYWYIQIIPKCERDRCDKNISILNKQDAWKIYMPKSLGGYVGYRKTIMLLESFDNLGPDFFRKNIELGFMPQEFSFSDYRKNVDSYYSYITKKWGWDRRDLSTDMTTEFYPIFRRLKFKKCQALIRDHIINELNVLLSRLGLQCKIEIEGIYTPESMDKAMIDFSEGEITFREASDLIFSWV